MPDDTETTYCPDCAGSGQNPWSAHGYCPTCGGTGEINIETKENEENE